MDTTLNRRPIASRRLRVFQMMAAWLARHHVSANTISMLGMAAAAVAAWALWTNRWVLAALCVQARLLANLLDGMVATEAGSVSPLGEIYNDAPDRVSDTLILVAFGYGTAAPTLGWIAALAAMATAYVRLLGQAVGLRQDFCGPMAKPHRMALITGASLIFGLLPQTLPLGAPVLCLLIAGSCLTCFRRLRHTVAALTPES